MPDTSGADAGELKRAIKEWERAFRNAHGREPTKAEVSATPEIAALYTDYRRAKSASTVAQLPAPASKPARPAMPLADGNAQRRKIMSPSRLLRLSKHAPRPSELAPGGVDASQGSSQAQAAPPDGGRADVAVRSGGLALPWTERDVPLSAAPFSVPSVAGIRGGGILDRSAVPPPARSTDEHERTCEPCAPPPDAEAAAAKMVLCSVERGCVCPEPGLHCKWAWMASTAPTEAEAARQANIAANNEVLRQLGLLPPAGAGALERTDDGDEGAGAGGDAGLSGAECDEDVLHPARAAPAARSSAPRAAPRRARRPAAARLGAQSDDSSEEEKEEEEEDEVAAAIGGRAHASTSGGTAGAKRKRASTAAPSAAAQPKRKHGRSAKPAAPVRNRANDNFVKTSLKRSMPIRLKRGGANQRRQARDGRRRRQMMHASLDGTARPAGGSASLLADPMAISPAEIEAVIAAAKAKEAAGAGEAEAAVSAEDAPEGAPQPGASGAADGADGAGSSSAPRLRRNPAPTMPAAARAPARRPRAAAARWHGADPLTALRDVFGHQHFRPGQREVVERVLAGRSTLVVLPTGAGKSLCYQLPALLCRGLVLVVSPLLALIEDQLSKLPPELIGARLTSAQSRAEATAVLASLRHDFSDSATPSPKLLFVSPERLLCPAFVQTLRSLELSFACVDEAHCVSQWAHHFRPSFLSLGRVLREQLRVRCVLALTATATPRTARSVMRALGIPADDAGGGGLLARPPSRPNLRLRAVRSVGSERHAQLARLLLGELKGARPAIVYCSTRAGTEAAASAIRAAGEPSVQIYHAGLSQVARERVHKRFERGAVPLLVATVAFGMGVDRADIRAVVHCGLPRSPENYVQESGRAGRDGKGGQCVCLFDETDRTRLSSLAHSSAVDAAAVGRLLEAVFCRQRRGGALPRTVLLQPPTMCAELDMTEETIMTILAFLEGADAGAAERAGGASGADAAEAAEAAGPADGSSDAADAATAALTAVRYARRLPDVHSSAEITFSGASPEELRARVPLMHHVLARAKLTRDGTYVAELGSAAAEFNISLEAVCAELSALQEAKQLSFRLRERSTQLELLAEPADVPALGRALCSVLAARERLESARVHALHGMMTRAAERPEEDVLAREIAAYFADEPAGARGASGAPHAADTADPDADAPVVDVAARKRQWLELQYAHADMRVFVRRYSGTHALTAVSIARVMHGISSVSFGAMEWRSCPFWGKYVAVDFDKLVELATAALVPKAKT